MRDHPRLGRILWSLLGAGVVAVALAAAWLHVRAGKHASRDDLSGRMESIPLPPYSTSPYLNTGSDAHYIGIAACASCHAKKHESYLLTAHSKALSDLDPNAEPADGSFFHEKSGRTYRIYRRDNQLRQEEIVRTQEGKEIARVDVPVRYLIGSGHFTRSYLIEINGFLHESPITWYASKKKWDMSPGYDFPQHWGFERAVKVGCLVCHAGRVEPAGDTLHRVTLHEKAIGCENCHGPGSKHEALQRAKQHVGGRDDLTIVNPGKLSRSRLESVCAVCHLNGPASIALRGRQETDYRPGMPLTDYRIDYRFDQDGKQMTVVGHIEQLRRSVCYQKSPELTCVTCHDPHARQKPKDSVAFYRQKCLDCHASQGCKLKQAERLKKDATDNCAGCHMPRGDTDLPHIAFTHHRIGRHSAEPPSPVPDRVPELVPADDVGHVPELDRERNLGLAYLAACRNANYAPYAGPFSERALALLEDVHAAGLHDGETTEALAEIWFYFKKDSARAGDYARQSVAVKGAPIEVRAMALTLLAACEMQDRDFESARGRLDELTRLRRYAHDWRLLGRCYLELDQPQQALPALLQALEIRPYRPVIHADLAETYRRLGDALRAADHQEKAQWLSEHRQD